MLTQHQHSTISNKHLSLEQSLIKNTPHKHSKRLDSINETERHLIDEIDSNPMKFEPTRSDVGHHSLRQIEATMRDESTR